MTTVPPVSVVIPAYNASATLDETLLSVRAQVYPALEIIVVDDGSTDATAAIAERHAAADPRIQVYRQANGGLAAARNAGWTRASADLIAFLDADDLWEPSKIRRQVDAWQAGGSRVGLVYCGSVRIDDAGNVVGHFPLAPYTGDVLQYLCIGNFIGNGSTSMVTREALIHADGFDPGLRAAGGQGCEDYLLQCRIAERFHYAVVPDYLVGYRYRPDNMSSNRPVMLRSWMLVVEEMTERQPALATRLRSGLRNYATWVIFDAVSRGAWAQVPDLLGMLTRFSPSSALAVCVIDAPREVLNRLGIFVRGRLRALRRRGSDQGAATDAALWLTPRDPEASV